MFIKNVFFSATETVDALADSAGDNSSAAVTSDDDNSSDYNEIIKLFGEDNFAGYDDGYDDEGNDSSISSNNGTSLESYDLEKYLQDWKIGDDIQGDGDGFIS